LEVLGNEVAQLSVENKQLKAQLAVGGASEIPTTPQAKSATTNGQK
jgi:hypothetical protein